MATPRTISARRQAERRRAEHQAAAAKAVQRDLTGILVLFASLLLLGGLLLRLSGPWTL